MLRIDCGDWLDTTYIRKSTSSTTQYNVRINSYQQHKIFIIPTAPHLIITSIMYDATTTTKLTIIYHFYND